MTGSRGNARPAFRYHSIDAWRGVACLSVLVFHVVGPRWPVVDLLWAGVPLFFVISGYCIAASADRHVRERKGWRAFMHARIRRIYPPYLVFIALAFLLSVVVNEIPLLREALFGTRHGLPTFPHPDSLTPWQWLGTLTLTEGWRPHLTADRLRWFQVHAWTLGYEEQFYAVTAALLVLVGPRWPIGAVIVSTVVAMLVAMNVTVRGVFLDGRWLMFAAGVGVFVHLHRNVPRWAAPALLVSLALVLVPTGAVFASTDQHLALELFIASIFGLVLILLHRVDGNVRNLPGVGALSWCGVRCYSVYLLHNPIARLVDGALVPLLGTGWLEAVVAVSLAIPVTLVVAAAFFLFVERRFLSRPPSATPQEMAAAGA